MKLLFVTGVFENDATGAARFAKLIYDNGGDDYTIMSEDTQGGDRIIKIKCKPAFYQTKLWQYFRISQFRKQLERHRDAFDVFIFNNPILAYGFKTTKPCFVFVHDEKLIKVKRTFRFDFIRKLILRRLEKKVLESGVHIISNSHHISKRILESYAVDKEKISLLYQGIDLSNKQESHSKELSMDIIKILFVKNDYRIGGLLELNQALLKLKNLRFKLTIIGTSTLTQHELQKADNIDLDILGIKNNHEVVDQMYRHDILCIPARYEPLGVAVMEGLAVGIPTITTGVGGLPEVTDNGKYVWECKPNDAQSIADQILACLSNHEERKNRSVNGKIFAHQRFDFKKVVARLNEILATNI